MITIDLISMVKVFYSKYLYKYYINIFRLNSKYTASNHVVINNCIIYPDIETGKGLYVRCNDKVTVTYIDT